MSYYTQAVMSEDVSLSRRITMCAAIEGADDPQRWTFEHRIKWATSPAWDSKWDSAEAAGIEDPGADASVITDGDILSVVQQLLHKK